MPRWSSPSPPYSAGACGDSRPVGARQRHQLEPQRVARAVRVLARIVLARDHVLAHELRHLLLQLDLLRGERKVDHRMGSGSVSASASRSSAAARANIVGIARREALPHRIGPAAAAVQVHVQARDAAQSIAGQRLPPRHRGRLGAVAHGDRLRRQRAQRPPIGQPAERIGQHHQPADIEQRAADRRQLPIDDAGQAPAFVQHVAGLVVAVHQRGRGARRQTFEQRLAHALRRRRATPARATWRRCGPSA